MWDAFFDELSKISAAKPYFDYQQGARVFENFAKKVLPSGLQGKGLRGFVKKLPKLTSEQLGGRKRKLIKEIERHSAESSKSPFTAEMLSSSAGYPKELSGLTALQKRKKLRSEALRDVLDLEADRRGPQLYDKSDVANIRSLWNKAKKWPAASGRNLKETPDVR